MIDLARLDEFRLRGRAIVARYGTVGDSNGGAFLVRSRWSGQMLKVLAANGGGWDHVSVSLDQRCPSWHEMSEVHRLFFKPDEVAYQLHVPAADHIDAHPFTLHLWRPHRGRIALPPKDFV